MRYRFSIKKLLATLAHWGYEGVCALKQYVMPKSLLYRFVLIILLPLVLSQGVAFSFFFNRHWETISRRLAADVIGEVAATAALLDKVGGDEEQTTALLTLLEKSLNLEVSFQKNTRLTPHPRPELNPATTPLFQALQNLPYPTQMTDADDRQQQIDVQLQEGVLTVRVPRKRFFSSTVYVFLLWLVGFSILFFMIAFLFMKNQVRSIERLSRASELFGLGKDEPFKPEGATEVKQAGLSFLQMKNRIQRYLTERTAMLAGVSHDLRTPLTRMKLQLSMMEQNDSIRDLEADITEMEQMLGGYLAFARGEGQERPQEISLNRLLQGTVDKLKKSGQAIDFHAEQEIRLLARSTDLTRAVSNLITNAGRYAKQTRITLGLRSRMAQIIVDDDGPGIPKNKRRDVFKAFFRLDPSRNQKTGGVGLGLSIARDIVLSHGGDIQLSDSPMGGLRAVILLPLVNQSLKNAQQ